MILRLAYLALTSMVTLLRLLPMSSAEIDIETLTLRLQFAVLRRRVDEPRFTEALAPLRMSGHWASRAGRTRS